MSTKPSTQWDYYDRYRHFDGSLSVGQRVRIQLWATSADDEKLVRTIKSFTGSQITLNDGQRYSVATGEWIGPKTRTEVRHRIVEIGRIAPMPSVHSRKASADIISLSHLPVWAKGNGVRIAIQRTEQHLSFDCLERASQAPKGNGAVVMTVMCDLANALDLIVTAKVAGANERIIAYFEQFGFFPIESDRENQAEAAVIKRTPL